MIYVQSMDLNKLGQILGLGYGDFLVEDAIFLTEKAKDFLRSRLGLNGCCGPNRNSEPSRN